MPERAAEEDVLTSLLRDHQDALAAHDVATLAALYAPDAVIESPMFDEVRGREAIAESFRRLFTLFPDYAIRLTDALFISRDGRVAEFSTVTGTQRAEFYGLPATGQQIEYETARLFSVRNGQIAHERRVYDFRGLLGRLEKARTDREMALASAVQNALCRTHRAGAYFAMAAASLPSRAIGGDFVEYLELAQGPGFGLAVGDVAGKGPAAALVAAMLQGMFSIVAMDQMSPSRVLSHLNRALCGRDMHSKFVTLVYGILMPDGRFTYSNAGHPPLLLVTPVGTRILDIGGPMLGAFDGASFPEETVMLSPGDRVVAFSDGVTDAPAPNGADFGMERLSHAVSGAHADTAESLRAHILGAVHTFSDGCPATDDITVAVLQYDGLNRP